MYRPLVRRCMADHIRTTTVQSGNQTIDRIKQDSEYSAEKNYLHKQRDFALQDCSVRIGDLVSQSEHDSKYQRHNKAHFQMIYRYIFFHISTNLLLNQSTKSFLMKGIFLSKTVINRHPANTQIHNSTFTTVSAIEFKFPRPLNKEVSCARHSKIRPAICSM